MKKIALFLTLAFFANANEIAEAKNSLKTSVNSATNKIIPGISDDESTITLFVKKTDENLSQKKSLILPKISDDNSTITFFQKNNELNATCKANCE